MEQVSQTSEMHDSERISYWRKRAESAEEKEIKRMVEVAKLRDALSQIDFEIEKSSAREFFEARIPFHNIIKIIHDTLGYPPK